jgi:hypothetical protein
LPNGSQGQQLADRSKERSLYVPGGAVVEVGGQTFVWVIDANGLVHQTPVKIDRMGERCRVLEGLREGQTVVVAPPALQEGQKVEVKD